MEPVSIVWHRADLRVHDHPALCKALEHGPVVGLVLLDAQLAPSWDRRRAWINANVRELRAEYESRGGALLVRVGDAASALPGLHAELARHAPVMGVHALRSALPALRARDAAVEAALPVPFHWHDGTHVSAPGSVRAKNGAGYRVHAPYLAAWRAAGAPEPCDAPMRIISPDLADAECGDIPDIQGDIEMPAAGETAALRALRDFTDRRMDAYADARDRLDGAGSSRLSCWISIGALSARTAAAVAWDRRGPGAAKWLAEIAWRDFLADMVHHRPSLLKEPVDERWNAFPWNDDAAALVAWREGATGIPAVDAAMRELRATGWISNRARMVAAQFLTKHLRVHWMEGARVFEEWLLDADAASNAGNWQWAAGLGIDNAPYFRVFNPVTQGKEHDPDGSWLRRWVPESNGSPAAMPDAIVDLARARRDYLADARELA
ncbi:MAG TPA: deoxyribodipyrimidine photo-lyase [Longimicrobiales bacterium]